MASVASCYNMRSAGQTFKGAAMVVPKDTSRKPFPSRWLPEYIRLPLDAEGRPNLPKYEVATVVQVVDRWRKLVGPLTAGGHCVWAVCGPQNRVAN